MANLGSPHTRVLTLMRTLMSVTQPPNTPDLTPAALEGLFAKEFAEAFASMGMFNLAVFGKTGSGKSTLINAIFGSDVASTGVGAPVTRGLIYLRHPDGFLGIYDSEGFETGTSGNAILAGLRSLIDADAAKPIAERIHAVWYLVRWSDRRFESAQEQFVRELAGMGLPVIIVLTQVPTRAGQIHPDALALADHINGLNLPVSPDGRVVLTNALVDQFSDSPVYGLQNLLDATYAVVPQAVERALTAAQVVDVSRKKKEVATIIKQAVTVAMGIGAIPVPFADAAVLVPNQVTMIARITAAWGLPPSKSRSLAVAGSVVLTGGATMAGRYAVTSLMKFIPGGAIAGSAISATVAGTLTKAVGTAWSRVCEFAWNLPDSDREAFLSGPEVTSKFTSYLGAGSGSIEKK